VAAYFEQHKSEFGVPEKVVVRQILVRRPTRRAT
jgi:hypothetical protein